MNSQERKSEHLTNRQIRVFISSTFRDMQEERELLVKKVFPELRRICDERFVSFTEVDLRWGITKEEAAEGKVLPICLEEINTCRPYFIGILGERYGWIPDAVPPEVSEREPWIKEHIGNRTSVTELEILHGVLNNQKMDGHAFFYFRDPAYVATRPAAEQTEMIERDIPQDITEFGPAEATQRTEERKAKLAALKETILKSGRPLVDPYKTPEELAAAVEKQFRDLIDKLYPKEEVPDPLDQQAAGHRSHALRKTLAYVDRPSHSQALAAFVAAPTTGKGLVVTGDSGSGKTALLAAFASSFISSAELAERPHPSTFLFEHYFGATPDSASVDGFLHRLLGELKRLANISDEMPSTPEKMREVLPLWLAQTSGGKPIVLVLDGLNQVQGEEADRRLNWLPRFFPAHIRVVASCLPGPALDILRERGWAEHLLPLADTDERGRMIDAFLKNYRKALGITLREQVLDAAGTANPLFLRTVLEELRQFGDFDKLPDKVAEYLKATTPQDLFRLVIRRWQNDFHAGRDLVNRSLRYLWAARQGLSEKEWLDLLADEQGPMGRQTWRPLLLAMEPHLVQRGSLWAFGHDFLRQAVESELLSNEDMKIEAHLALAEYFEQQVTAPRKAEELPWQLRQANDRERLPQHLLDIPLFLLIQARDRNELMGYWVWLGQERTMGKAYVQSYDQWAADKGENAGASHAAAALGFFLSIAALHAEAEPLYRRALTFAEAFFGPSHREVALRLNDLAMLMHVTNRLVEAEPLYRRALAINRTAMGKYHTDVTTENLLAGLLEANERFAEAEQHYRRALSICEVHQGETHPDVAVTLNNLAGLLTSANRPTEAEPLMRRALSVEEANFGLDHPMVAIRLNNLAGLLSATGRPVEAEPLHCRALAIWEASFGKSHPNVIASLNNLAIVLQVTNRTAEAESHLRRALAICEDRLSVCHWTMIAASLSSLAYLLSSTHRLAEAESLYRRALAIEEAYLGTEHLTVAGTLNSLVTLICSAGRLPEAEPLLRRVADIYLKFACQTGSPHPKLSVALGNYNRLLLAMGKSDSDVRNSLAELAGRHGFELGRAGVQENDERMSPGGTLRPSARG